MKAVKRAIIICWAMLIVCFIIKLFCGNWFEIICNNEHFIYVCNFIDNHPILQDTISAILYLVSGYYIIKSCALLVDTTIKQEIVIFVVLIAIWWVKYLSLVAKLVLEMVNIIGMPILLNTSFMRGKNAPKISIKETWYLGFIGCIFIFTFQIISLITRNIGLAFIGKNTLLAMILMIDYYIMVALYYLYVKLKKGGKEQWDNGVFSFSAKKSNS